MSVSRSLPSRSDARESGQSPFFLSKFRLAGDNICVASSLDLGKLRDSFLLKHGHCFTLSVVSFVIRSRNHRAGQQA